MIPTSATLNSNDANREELKSILPFGESIRPLVNASNLSDYDIKYTLQRRGIFVKNHSKSLTVPIISTIILSPKEFEILRNRQNVREGNIKTSTAQSDWLNESINISDAISEDLKSRIESLFGNSISYDLNTLNCIFDNPNKLIIKGDIIRKDWTKDVFSNTSFHDWSLTIERQKGSSTVQYKSEITAPETKDLIEKIQKDLHKILQEFGAISKTATIQKILSTHFKSYELLFEYIYSLTENIHENLSLSKIINIDSGINNKKKFPEKFEWLKGYVDEISLHGKSIESSAIIEIGKLGILIFGDLDAEFKFNYSEVKGTCIIRFGFPKYYEKLNSIEFEAKVVKLELDHLYSHISKEKTKRLILSDFQKFKYDIFEKFKVEGKVDTAPKDSQNQYELF